MIDRIVVADAFKHVPVKSGAEGITAGFSRIAYKGKTWALIHQGQRHVFIRPDDGTALPYLDVVIVGVNKNISKQYYPPGTYQEDSINPPTCAAVNGDVPDPGVPIPQAKSCGMCRHNEWLPNRKGKECQDHKRVAVILLPDMKTRPALGAPVLDPVFLKIPPASLKSWKAYCDDLTYQGIPYEAIITRIEFDPNAQFQMNFTLKQPLTNAEAPLVLPLLDSPLTRNLIGTMPELRQATPPLPEERQETGLMAAFAAQQTLNDQAKTQMAAAVTNLPTKRGPGRPKRVVEQEAVPEPKEEANEATPEVAKPVEQGERPQEDWEKTDATVDNSLEKLLSKRVGDMLK
jgi:hypothetical protein